MKNLRLFTLGLTLCCAFQACKKDDSGCTEGATQACLCVGGESGVQSCGEDGAWESCDCSGGETDTDTDTDTDADTDADTDTDTGADAGAETGDPVTITGALQKGPLLQNSTLMVAMLDPSGAPTGANYTATTTSNLGDFSVTALTTGPAELVGEGFYFNEIINEVSETPVTLRAIYDVAGPGDQQAYLNVFTHMSSGLALKLLTEGKSVSEAVAEAEKKLFDALGILHPEGELTTNGTSLDLLGADSPDNQYAMAVSCILAKAAELAAEWPEEADSRLLEIINDIRSQLQNSGTITPEYKQYIRDGEAALDPQNDCVQNLADYLYDKTGVVYDLPDPNTCADMDGDGIPNADDPDIDEDKVLNEDDWDPYDPNILSLAYFDEATGLIWQVYPEVSGADIPYSNWYYAMEYCKELDYDGNIHWRLPSIRELITLFRGCVNGANTGDLSPSICEMTPEGCISACNYTINCQGCKQWEGPGVSGTYRDPVIHWLSEREECHYWSSSSYNSMHDHAWLADFSRSIVEGNSAYNSANVRCVRSAP